jgi:curved DNA-binding protein CbpA
VTEDPFRALGLPRRADLSDDDVRAAWRRIAAATHPDRDDGGDPARYSAAAAAYDTLRTSFGRGEALADLGLAGSRGASRAPRHGQAGRVRPVSKRTALSAVTVAVAAIAVAAVGWTPASIALLAGAATWLFAWHTRRP